MPVSRKVVLRAVVVAFVVPVLVAGCGGSGPSKDDVKQAMIDDVAAMSSPQAAEAYAAAMKVADLKCQKTGDDTYNCEVLVEQQGQQIPMNYVFTKLAGKWHAGKA
jgi:hypothetical protein